jgi:hypothetical protein
MIYHRIVIFLLPVRGDRDRDHQHHSLASDAISDYFCDFINISI